MEFACKRWHYAGTSQRGAAVNFGVWESGRFIGGLQFTRGSSTAVMDNGVRFGISGLEVAELARVALAKHEVSVSRIGAIALRLFHRGWSGIRLVISYADPSQGHHGGIYQAMNWAFIGETAPDYYFLDSSGRRYHSRALSGSRMPKGLTLKRVDIPGKHRYAYALDPSLWPRLREAAIPYPKKCVASDTSDTSGVQPEKGGAILTATLQT